MHAHHKDTWEKRPSDDDFTRLDWHTFTHPVQDPLVMVPKIIEDIEQHYTEDHHDIVVVPTPSLDVKATDHQEAAPKKKSSDKQPKASKTPAPAHAPAPAKHAKKETTATAAPAKKTTKPQPHQ